MIGKEIQTGFCWKSVMVCFPFLFHVPLLYLHLSFTPFLFAPSFLTLKEQSCPDCPTFGQNVQKFYISSFGLFVQKFPDTIRITSTTILIILKINTIPPIKPPAIQFKAKTPTLYNAPNTINHYYQQEVQHDMYGGGWHEKGIV